MCCKKVFSLTGNPLNSVQKGSSSDRCSLSDRAS
ncbi:hypothetical protein F383_02175 [Gossypium arboreum]|uniref:Uncharacterized protein n=1 Tax=Gossypium arboreum TaxID=29729 RepID=A0A0B0PMM0_GOSAR|nr:hypothetical protein F383_02175 [Gossypium arboreum]